MQSLKYTDSGIPERLHSPDTKLYHNPEAKVYSPHFTNGQTAVQRAQDIISLLV